MSKELIVILIQILLVFAFIVIITAFLTAKYLVRSNIDNNEIPIDTSTRM